MTIMHFDGERVVERWSINRLSVLGQIGAFVPPAG